jgi:ubiquinone biosynthesis O-methyltransferase
MDRTPVNNNEQKENGQSSNIQKFFSKKAIGRNQRYATEVILRYEQTARYNALVSMLDPKPSDMIFDVGCGSGMDLIPLSKKCLKCIGIDFSEGMIHGAKEVLLGSNVNNVEVEFGDATNLRFQDGQFDKVFASEVLEHIPDYQKAVNEMARVLKTGGSLVVTTPNRYSLYGFDRYVIYEKIFGKKSSHSYDYWKTFSELKHALESSGLKVVDYSGFNYMPGYLVSYNLPRFMKKILVMVVRELEKVIRKILPKNGAGICVKAIKVN